jgi:adenylate cyclase
LDASIDLRIGINTGFCTVGNFGSDQRIDFAIIGSEVNLAARMEASAAAGGLLLAHETNALVKGAILTEPAGAVTVKGFARPLETYSVLGTREAHALSDHSAAVTFVKDPSRMTSLEKKRARNELKQAMQGLND